jgi:hypothetical protein
MAPPIFRCIVEIWKISCRYVYVFRKLNSINPINHNLRFCEATSSIPLEKLFFLKNPFYKGNARLGFTKTKIVIDMMDGILFSKYVNIST